MDWEKNDESFAFGGLPEAPEQKERKKVKDMISNNDIEKVIRYETTIERSLYKALHELQRVQAARLGEKVALPVAVDISLTKEE